MEHISSHFCAYLFSSSTFFCSFKWDRNRKCFHSLPYSYKMRTLCKWAFSACSIKLSSCGLCIIIWPCLVKDIWSISCFPSLSNQTLQGVLYEVFPWISYRTIPFILPSQCYGAIVWLMAEDTYCMCKYDLPRSTLVRSAMGGRSLPPIQLLVASGLLHMQCVDQCVFWHYTSWSAAQGEYSVRKICEQILQ